MASALSGADWLPVVVIAGGVGVYLWSRGDLAAIGLPPPGAGRASGASPAGGIGQPVTTADQAVAGQGVSPAPTVGRLAVPLVGSAVGTAAAAGAGGLALGAVAGVAAGGVLLAWAIIDKGLFRGGEEGVKVNPARDRFFDAFVQAYFPGAGSERQYDAFVQATIDAGMDGNEAAALIKAVYAADTMAELTRAVEAVRAAFQRRGFGV